MNVLEDSRLQVLKGSKRMPWFYDNAWHSVEVEPIYCANCGTLHGYVPVDTTTFACWLCIPCAETHGAILGTYMMPDEVFWGKVYEEVSPSTPVQELQALTEATWGAFSKLLREAPKVGR